MVERDTPAPPTAPPHHFFRGSLGKEFVIRLGECLPDLRQVRHVSAPVVVRYSRARGGWHAPPGASNRPNKEDEQQRDQSREEIEEQAHGLLASGPRI